MRAEIIFWMTCYLVGFFGAWAFDKPLVNANPVTQNANYTFKINAVPSLNKIENFNGTDLGELRAVKFESLNQIETKNIVIQNPQANSQPTPTLTTYKQTIEDLSLALVKNDYRSFNALLSSEPTSIFGENAVKELFETTQITYGGIIAVNTLSPIQQNGNWATQVVETKTQSGLISKIRITLHLENNQWKLFGTQEVP